MALPKLNDKPKYELVIPSTQQKVKFRPYLVREEKVLMMAMESEDQIQTFEAIADTIVACVDDEIDKTKLTSFDVEYMFVKIRSKSVGENIKFTPKCGECEEENEVNIALDDLKMEENTTDPVIKLNDEVSIRMQYPSYISMLDKDIVDSTSVTKQTFGMVLKCIESVMTEDENMLFKEETFQSQMDFVESLSSTQFDEIRKFIEGIPQVSYDASYKCKKCKKDNELFLKGMNDFF